VRQKEAGIASELVAITVGDKNSQDSLRTALAMGIDRAIQVDSEQALQPLAVARLLKAVVDREQTKLVITGKQSIDRDNKQTAQMLSALMQCGQATFASILDVTGNSLQVTREIDGGLETLSLELPAVVSTDLRLNEPRYVKLPNIMKAKKKPLDVIPATVFGVDIEDHLELLSVEEPVPREAGERVESVTQLLDKVRQQTGVL
jgi:electron transfer flavoprotein beta subunit